MFELDDDIMQQLRATFQVEAAEHVQAMNRALLALENNPEGEERVQLLEEIFREAHSLKGAAGAADVGEAEDIAHRLENVFGAAKADQIALTRDLCDVLYEGIDAVSSVVQAALQDKPHGVDLPTLRARLDAAEQGRVIPKQGTSAKQRPAEPAVQTAPPPPTATAAPAETPKQVPTPPVSAESVEPKTKSLSENPSPNLSGLEDLTGFRTSSKAPRGEERKKLAAAGPVIEETIRVATSKIDSLMAQAGELLVAGLKIDQRLNEVAGIGHFAEDWNREWLKARAANSQLFHESEADKIRPLLKLLDLSQDRLRSLAAQVSDLQRGFARDALHLSRVTNDLGEGVMKVRMLPVSTVFDAFPRLVRDLARERDKEIDLQTEGGETELDRKVLEEIKDPLIHLLRNSVDHGVETPEERARAGKPRRGQITVKAFQKGNNIVIQVADDGAGINRQKVKQAALKAGLMSADELETTSDDEALRLIFAPGLSTSSTITDISGRGVGMDVVRKNVEALQGQVDVDSSLGQGTTIALTLPLTLATTQELLVQVGDQTYGIPISAVERIQRIQLSNISTVEGRQAIVVDHEPVSLARLADVLERPDREQVASDAHAPLRGGPVHRMLCTDETLRVSVVILSSAKKRIAFLVDAVVGQQESVVKSLGKQLARVRNVAGATILGTGQVIMTLNPTDLIKSVRLTEASRQAASTRRPSAAKEQKAKQRTILVVDDSLSTRTLEKNILETAGYKVTLATDGLEALNLLQSNGNCDLIVSDILMPRMSGLELTTAIKGDPRLKKTPVVLVTSLESRADKERGIEVGADAYIVKSTFDQMNLLQTVAQLI